MTQLLNFNEVKNLQSNHPQITRLDWSDFYGQIPGTKKINFIYEYDITPGNEKRKRKNILFEEHLNIFI